jgi:hypothetical protein
MSDNQTKHTEYLCKDCKHSSVSFADMVFYFGNPPSYDYKCLKNYKESVEKEDVVTGPQKSKAEYESCRMTRATRVCGPNAKLWSPKHKKDLFKLITKDHSE